MKTLKEVRKEKNLTQQELADKLGMHQENLSRIENGLYYPKVTTLFKIESILNAENQINWNKFPSEEVDILVLEGIKKLNKRFPIYLVLQFFARILGDSKLDYRDKLKILRMYSGHYNQEPKNIENFNSKIGFYHE